MPCTYSYVAYFIRLIGDHYQLPPVVKNAVFQKHSHLDQSLFYRFIRLGYPAVLLDRQGRARPEIAALYSWRYAGAAAELGDLPAVSSLPMYRTANAGFVHTTQAVDVPDFNGKGESCPTPYFYQVHITPIQLKVYYFIKMFHYHLFFFLSRIWAKRNTSLLCLCTCDSWAILLPKLALLRPTTARNI